jgi:signal transduction histidine kinase
MVDGVPDQQRFFDIIGGAIDHLARSGRRVRAFGEIVAVLAAEGHYDTAVQLEMLWNELGKTRSFALLCGYPMKLFTGRELVGPLGEVAQAHDRVVPTESVMHVPVDARMREILSLQQKARSLEVEVAQRCAAEDRLRVALRAEQAARAEAEAALRQRDEFVSVASHELKTPLTTLAGYAQLVLRRFNRDGELDPQRVVPALHSITNQADRLARLLGHLLDVSRLDESKLTLERQPTEVIALIEQTVGPARLWSEKHTILVSAPSTLVAEVDALRLEQVLTNLLDNAVKYSPDGGSVDVQVAKRRGFMELAIRDHGLGIPANRRRQIFERFYQAHSSGYRSGLGLGLYISRQIVELHGGSIRAEFPRGGGTRFVVRLPLKQPLPERSPTLQLAAD